MSVKVYVAMGLVLMAAVLNVWSQHMVYPSSHTTIREVVWTPEERAAAMAAQEQRERDFRGGEHHKALRFRVALPGVETPIWKAASQVQLPMSTAIVGLTVRDKSFAFVLSEMVDPRYHIANLMLVGQPISVAYCNLSDCVRVLTQTAEERIPLKVGGLDIENSLVLELLGVRYSQLSDSLPLLNYPFKRMTLGDWLERHPNSLIYLGPQEAEGELKS